MDKRASFMVSLKILKFAFGGSLLPKTTFCAPYLARDFSIFLNMFRVSSRWRVCRCREVLDSFCRHLLFIRLAAILSFAFIVHVFPMSSEALLGLGSILWTLGQTYKAAGCVLARFVRVASCCVKLVVCNLLGVTSSNMFFTMCWFAPNPVKALKARPTYPAWNNAKPSTSCNLHGFLLNEIGIGQNATNFAIPVMSSLKFRVLFSIHNESRKKSAQRSGCSSSHTARIEKKHRAQSRWFSGDSSWECESIHVNSCLFSLLESFNA